MRNLLFGGGAASISVGILRRKCRRGGWGPGGACVGWCKHTVLVKALGKGA